MGILNTALIGKLKKIKANITDVLIKTNTVEYTPTEDYHPATKKYVDTLLAQVTAKDDIVYTSLISSTNTVILSSTPVTKSIKYFVQAVNTVNDEVYTSEINVLNDNNDLYIKLL